MRALLLRSVIAIISLTAAGSAVASTVTIDFEGFAPGLIIDDEYAAAPAPGVTISAVNLSTGPDVAVIFDTNAPTGGDFDLGAPFSTSNTELSQLHPNGYSPGNVLIIHETNNCGPASCDNPDDEGSRPAGFFKFVFEQTVTLESLDFFDIEGAENNHDPNSEVLLFDGSGIELTSFPLYPLFVPGTGGDNTWDRLDFGSINGVKSLIVELNGSGAIDNLTYSIPNPPGEVVPVPASVWLFGSALGLLSWTRRLNLRGQ